METKRSRIFVDAVDGDTCTLLVGRKGVCVTLPSEGDVLIMTLRRSENLRRSSRRSVAGLLEKLGERADASN
jgi:hypothetical protein